MSTTTLPAVIDALVVDLLPVVPALRPPRTQIFDGAPTVDAAGDVVAIGLAPDDVDIDAALTEASYDGADAETYEIMCVARSWTGGGLIKPRRDRAFELLDAISNMIKTNPQLAVDGTPTVTYATVTRWKYLPIIAQQATVVSLVFWVGVHGFPGRPS